jgi:hypothetical protein
VTRWRVNEPVFLSAPESREGVYRRTGTDPGTSIHPPRLTMPASSGTQCVRVSVNPATRISCIAVRRDLSAHPSVVPYHPNAVARRRSRRVGVPVQCPMPPELQPSTGPCPRNFRIWPVPVMPTPRRTSSARFPLRAGPAPVGSAGQSGPCGQCRWPPRALDTSRSA